MDVEVEFINYCIMEQNRLKVEFNQIYGSNKFIKKQNKYLHTYKSLILYCLLIQCLA